MSLARDQHDVIAPRPCNGGLYRFAPAANLARANCTCHDVGTDARGIFSTRIIVCYYDHIGPVHGSHAHRCALTNITIAARPKNSD